jgi:vancomycin aglycone glucosyltransferase
MLQILLSTIGSRGDVQPLAALGRELMRMGHRVRMCVPPDFRQWLEGMGMEVTPVGPELRQFAAARPAQPPAMTAEMRRRMAAGTVAMQFEALEQAASGCDVIVAATALQVAVRSVAESKGLGYVFVGYAPNVFPAVAGTDAGEIGDYRAQWRADELRFQDLFGEAVNQRRVALGLEPVDHLREYMVTNQPWLAADAVLAPWPDGEALAVVQTGARMMKDERGLGEEIEAFLAAGEAPLYFGFGSMRMEVDAVGVARQLGKRAIVSKGWFEEGPTVDGADCLVIGEPNLQKLFPRVAAVVHHGGAGTTMTAALAGVPQVVMPKIYDQHYWGKRVSELGVGCSGVELVEALREVLERQVGERARELAGRLGRDGARRAAERLVKIHG